MFPNPTEASMNSDHDIEVTEETSVAAEALESASETVLDHAGATAVDAADHSDDEEDGDEEEGDDEDEDGEESDEDGAEAAKLSGDDDEDEDDADDAVKAEG